MKNESVFVLGDGGADGKFLVCFLSVWAWRVGVQESRHKHFIEPMNRCYFFSFSALCIAYSMRIECVHCTQCLLPRKRHSAVISAPLHITHIHVQCSSS